MELVMAVASHESITAVAPGSVVRVRDEDWLVTKVEQTKSGRLVHVYGLTELVRDTEAAFYSDLDDIQVVDPKQARIVADDSPRYRRSRLFLETTLRKTPEPATSNRLTVSTKMLAHELNYQRIAVAQALSLENVRPRILIADAVGLGKTLEIGMILSELVARGRGDNILIVTPKHVLEQMQHEMWCRFALPFVRLDSLGIQRVRRKIPATRNPFSYYKRVIISIDTLKTPRYREHLKKRRWDAVVIDESHNVTNAGTQNNELARLLAARTDALILASATPHNGDEKAFAELLRLLDPTVVAPDGTVDQDAVSKLIVRRHRYSSEVAEEVGSDWARREEPNNIAVEASPEENAVSHELSLVWLHNPEGAPCENRLFSWTLAKAFLSSPAALVETIQNRLRSNPGEKETEALTRLLELAQAANSTKAAKYEALVSYLKSLGVGRGSKHRAVVFSERVATLHFLEDNLPKSLGLKKNQVAVLHGGMSDVEQQAVVEEFKRGNSDLRVLVTGDVASEGVNLHAECHDLVHYDIPWSLIRIEQRNGRIDRYGQKHAPRIAALMLIPEDEQFSGDIRVLASLMDKEHAAHQVFSDVACVMGKYKAESEEHLIREVLAQGKDLDEVVPEPSTFTLDSFEAMLAGADGDEGESSDEGCSSASAGRAKTVEVAENISLFDSDAQFLDEAMKEAFEDPAREAGWRVHDKAIATLEPTSDLRRRLAVLPQDYIKERGVLDELRLALVPEQASRSLEAARASEDMTWPQVHFLSPLHPVLDWAADRALASISRDDVLAVRGNVAEPEFLLLGAISNGRGQLLTRTFIVVQYGFPSAQPDVAAYLKSVGVDGTTANPYPVDITGLQEQLPGVVDEAQRYLDTIKGGLIMESTNELEAWMNRADKWGTEADALVQRAELRKRKQRVQEEMELATLMTPQQAMVRPLLVIVPKEN